jgi:peptide/nickel transport system substrate-binding protein
VDLLKSKILPFFSSCKKFLAGIFLPAKSLGFLSHNSKSDLVSEEIDKKLIYSLSKTKIPSWSQLKHIGRVLSPGEKRSILIFSLLLALSAGFLGINFLRANLVSTPVYGGEYIEAMVGSPQHINPLYASANDVDADISRLIFSSLFYQGEDGRPVGDLVSSYEISGDGRIYTLHLRDDAEWHHGGRLTSADVVFTFNAIKDQAYNSPLRQSFGGAEITSSDDFTVIFTLSENYAPFLSLLTFGILPAEKWQNISPQSAALSTLNLKPEGSGPYKFKSFTKANDGSVLFYKLTANKDYYLGRPNIKNVIFKFFTDSVQAIAALNNGDVNALSYLPVSEKDSLIVKNSVNINNLGLSQMKVVFFNSGSNPVLKDAKVRSALSCAISRADIISSVLAGGAEKIYGPILPNNFAYYEGFEKCDFDTAKAQSILSESGWKKFSVDSEQISSIERKASTSASLLSDEDKNILSLGVGEWLYKEETVNKITKKTFLTFRLSYLDDEDNSEIAFKIAEEWGKLGIKAFLSAYSSGQLQSSVIKPRDYDVLLFAQQVGADPDVYAFWHSSQSGKNGLNLSDYDSEEADNFLEDGRVASSTEDRIRDYQNFQNIVAKDVPAVFLYRPFYYYVQNKKIKNFSLKNIFTPADRFNGIHKWYIKSGWKIK